MEFSLNDLAYILVVIACWIMLYKQGKLEKRIKQLELHQKSNLSSFLRINERLIKQENVNDSLNKDIWILNNPVRFSPLDEVTYSLPEMETALGVDEIKGAGKVIGGRIIEDETPISKGKRFTRQIKVHNPKTSETFYINEEYVTKVDDSE